MLTSANGACKARYMTHTPLRSVSVSLLLAGLVSCAGAPEPAETMAAEAKRPAAARAPSSPGIDAPELARLGSYAVGVSEEVMVLPERPGLTIEGVASGQLERTERRLPIRIWYPAQPAAGPEATSYPYTLRRPGVADMELLTPGIARKNAPPAAGERFPLVFVSHGYGGWSASMSYLTENLASKGYVVAAIDHLDRPPGGKTNASLDFANVLIDRSRDQREAISQLLSAASQQKSGWAGLIDPGAVGLIGYSMGGYGALTTAGADIDPESPTVRLIPASGRKLPFEAPGPDVSGSIKALVAIAPWGGQPANRTWSAASLGRIRAPVLMIDGDQDDVVDYRRGVRGIFDALTSERHLLVFRGARHNVGNNPAPPDFDGPFSTWEFFADPIWRGDRMNAINQHFITAFLDLNLKGDSSRRPYLSPATERSEDGVWTQSPGQQVSGATAGDGQPRYWRGFQARSAMGLDLEHRAPGEAPSSVK